MLDIRVGDGPMRNEHERIVRKLLTRGDGIDDRARTERLPPEVVALALQHWRGSMYAEHRSATVFSQLLPDLIEAGATIDLKTTVLRLALDELRHAELCARVVASLGGEPEVEGSLVTARLPRHPKVGPLERALRNVVYACCLSETVSVSLTATMRDRATDSVAGPIASALASDEVLHARFGWSFLAEVMPHLDEPARARTGKYLEVGFFHLDRQYGAGAELPPKRSAEVEQGLASLGVFELPALREIFEATVHEAIIPGLEAHGLDAKGAWARKHPR